MIVEMWARKILQVVPRASYGTGRLSMISRQPVATYCTAKEDLGAGIPFI
jgi:hypothetical protein